MIADELFEIWRGAGYAKVVEDYADALIQSSLPEMKKEAGKGCRDFLIHNADPKILSWPLLKDYLFEIIKKKTGLDAELRVESFDWDDGDKFGILLTW